MRIFALSDIHVDFDDNAIWVSSLSAQDFREDLLILAGDVSKSPRIAGKELGITGEQVQEGPFRSRQSRPLGHSRRPGKNIFRQVHSVEWSLRHTVTADILVNCTPVGMHPNVDDSPFDKHYLRPSMIVFDAVYNPENTLLIKEARNRNCTVVTGVEMFVRQACFQFQLFTGEDGPADLMREVVRRAIGAAKI